MDFHRKGAVGHICGLSDEIRPRGLAQVGQRLLATDGDVTHWAVAHLPGGDLPAILADDAELPLVAHAQTFRAH